MIQILGLREFTGKDGKLHKHDTFFDKKWRAASVADLFENIENFIKKIPENERYNLYYTCADCTEEKGRKLVSQSVIPFDIDGIDIDRRRDYIPVVCKTLGLEAEKTGILFSGNGLQFIIEMLAPFTSTKYFDENRVYYKAICNKINKDLENAGLPGKADETVFSAARIMRLPLTLNKKPGKPERMGELYYRKIIPIAFDLVEVSGVPRTADVDQVSSYPPADGKGVIEGCDFLQYCKKEPESVTEGEWYAMLSITARLPDGVQLSHNLSTGHPKYTHGETESKIEQALSSSGPRTCKNINKLWGKCGSCKYFEKIKSPILIKGDDFIATKDTGFHNLNMDGKPTKPNYEDLRRYFESLHPYTCPEGSKVCYTWNGKFWEQYSDSLLENFAYRHFRPFVKMDSRREFKDVIYATNLKHPDWFSESTNRKINFQNGVLDLSDPKKELIPHDPALGFRYVLPYDYDREAKAPRFKEFLREVTKDRKELIDVLMEFAGYAFSNDECWTAKALILTGDGANGKSTFLNVLTELAGRDTYSVLNLSDLAKETSRFAIDGKLFNASEETPTYALMESSAFKGLVSGGIMQIRQLYKTAYKVKNRCKFMFACNELPKTRDTSPGLFRRLLIVPFEAVFEGDKSDPFLHQKLMKELPGIFNLVIEGYERLSKQRRFTESKIIQSTVTNYRQDVDIIENFRNDQLTVNGMSEDTTIPLSKLYGEYSLYSESMGERPEPYTTFCKRLKRHIPQYDDRVRRRCIEGKWQRILLGVTHGADASAF